MIKLIVSDLDGTLLDHNRQIIERDRQAVRKAYESGFTICIASGRMNSEIQMVMEPFAQPFHAVGQNGATVRLNNARLLGAKEFTPELSAQLLQAVPRDAFINFIHCTNDDYFARVRSEAIMPYEARVMTSSSVHDDLEQALASDELRCSKMVYFGELERLNQLEEQLNRTFGDRIETFISDKDCLDVMPRNVSKGTGISLLIKELGIKPEEIACIGDSFNDLSMFALTPHSYAMAQSPEEIRNRANTVVNSVAEAIDHIMAYNTASLVS
ncbi:HAD family hydrolase [Paenibacillus glycanilyticus]|uniref:Haloacid dehalogenase n=1 Tax=Paenibacillus glycanilyticus TaxID=126569 RepID=A0ABQ6GK08_9BACL|nr:HAD family hydrolase [Paenibacillus glycanilyticus]GLX70550.1 haloacid dehalogenase [Paenibacillus glycanilyticus]